MPDGKGKGIYEGRFGEREAGEEVRQQVGGVLVPWGEIGEESGSNEADGASRNRIKIDKTKTKTPDRKGSRKRSGQRKAGPVG